MKDNLLKRVAVAALRVGFFLIHRLSVCLVALRLPSACCAHHRFSISLSLIFLFFLFVLLPRSATERDEQGWCGRCSGGPAVQARSLPGQIVPRAADPAPGDD